MLFSMDTHTHTFYKCAVFLLIYCFSVSISFFLLLFLLYHFFLSFSFPLFFFSPPLMIFSLHLSGCLSLIRPISLSLCLPLGLCLSPSASLSFSSLINRYVLHILICISTIFLIFSPVLFLLHPLLFCRLNSFSFHLYFCSYITFTYNDISLFLSHTHARTSFQENFAIHFSLSSLLIPIFFSFS